MSGLLIDKIKVLLSENGINFGELTQAAIYANPQNRGRITILVYENSRENPSYVAKVSRSISGRQALEREQKCLQRCMATNEFLKHQINRLYWSDEDVAFILEPYFGGQNIANLRNYQKASQRVLNWLIQLQKASSGPIWNKKDFVMFGQDLIEQAKKYYEILPANARLLGELERRMKSIDDFEIQATVVHGDLTIKNLVIDGNKVKVFDWEWIQEHGWPLIDAWFYLFSVSGNRKLSSSYREIGEIITRTLVGSTQFSKQVQSLIDYYNGKQNYPRDVVKCFILLTLLDTIRRDHLVSEAIGGRSEWFFKILSSLGKQSEEFWKFVDSL